jgi:hypothetical protein
VRPCCLSNLFFTGFIRAPQGPQEISGHHHRPEVVALVRWLAQCKVHNPELVEAQKQVAKLKRKRYTAKKGKRNAKKG